jgi:uncharacterized repeat protein (TIGR01451 family)
LNRRQVGESSSHYVLGGILLLVAISVAALALVSRIAPGVRPQDQADSRPVGLRLNPTQIQAAYSHLPLIFEPNQGQADSQVKFLARGSGYGLFLTGHEALLALRQPSQGATDFSLLKMHLAGANPDFQASGENPLPGKSNYFIGNDPSKWRRDVPQFAGVRYRDVYPGIDLVYHGNQGRLEYDFEVAPGAEPTRLALEFAGALHRHLDAHGNLILSLPSGDVAVHAPRAYQKVGANEQPVSSSFRLQSNGDVGFDVGSYDPSRTLVIDPILTFSTYLGGSGNEACTIILGSSTPIPGCPAVAVDLSSNAYIAGSTTSVDFPIPVGNSPYQGTLKGTANIFVAKFNTSGSTEEFATYIGGSGTDTTAGVAVDLAFNVVVTGNTSSTNFPTMNGFQSSPVSPTNKHVFVSKLNPAGTTLLYSTYLSGNGTDVATGVALDPGGNAYVTGTTTSTEVQTGYPSSSGSFQPSPATGSNIQFFLTKVNPSLSGTASVPYSTYFGGGNSIRTTGPAAVGGGVAVDINSNIYITGGTSFLHVGGSNDFPILNAYQGCLDSPSTPTCPTDVSAYDVFVAELNPLAITGTQLIYSTYLGGTADDIGYGIAVDSALSAYVTGSTDSSDFPAAGTGVFQATYAGNTDAFVAKLGTPTVTGTEQGTVPLLYFTYLGGSGTDTGLGITVDTLQGARVTGWTNSTNFPILNNPVQLTYGPVGPPTDPSDAFVARIDTSGTSGVNGIGHYSTYLGGSAADYGTSIAVDPQGASYVAGETQSNDFLTAAAFQPALDGKSDAFLSKLGPILSLGVTATAAPGVVGVGSQVTFTYTVTNSGDLTNNVTFTDSLPPSGASFVSATTSPGFCSGASGGIVLCNLGTLNAGATATVTVILVPTPPTTPGSAFQITNSGSAGISGSILSSAQATVTVNDYTLTVAPPRATVVAGVPAYYTATVTPTGNIPNSVSISCSALPTGASCVETTNPLPNLSEGPASTALIINTTMRVTTLTQLLRKGGLYAALLPISGLAFMAVGIGGISRRKQLRMGLLIGCFFGLILFQAGCGSTSTTNTTGTPAGTYIVTITATSGQATRNTTVTLVVQ